MATYDEVMAVRQDAPVPAPDNAAVVQPDNAAPVATEGTGASEQAAETPEQAKAKAEKSVIDRRERAWRNQNQMAKRLWEQNQKLTEALLQRQLQPAPQPATPQVDGPPQREQFDSWEAWQDAKAEWKAEKKAAEIVDRRLRDLGQQAQQTQAQEINQRIEHEHYSRVEQFAQANPEFQEVLERDDIEINPVAAEALKRMPEAPAIMLAIHRQPQIAAYLNSVSPAEQFQALGEMRAMLRFRPPQISKAPPPGEPVGGRGGPEGGPKSQAEYYAEITRHHRGGKK